MRQPHHYQREIPMGGSERQHFGLTVFFQDEDGEQRAVVRDRQRVLDGMRDAIREMETWPGKWRVACVSTPATIWLDLQGRRELTKRGGHTPEARLLAQVGRLDLLASSLRR